MEKLDYLLQNVAKNKRMLFARFQKATKPNHQVISNYKTYLRKTSFTLVIGYLGMGVIYYICSPYTISAMDIIIRLSTILTS